MVDDRQKKKVHRYECKAIVVTHFSFVLDFNFVFYLFVVDLFVVQFYFVRCIIILFLLRKNLKIVASSRCTPRYFSRHDFYIFRKIQGKKHPSRCERTNTIYAIHIQYYRLRLLWLLFRRQRLRARGSRGGALREYENNPSELLVITSETSIQYCTCTITD